MRAAIALGLLALLATTPSTRGASVTQTDGFNVSGTASGGVGGTTSLTLFGQDTGSLGTASIDFNREEGITFADIGGSLFSYGDHDGGDFSGTHECILDVPGTESYVGSSGTTYDLSGTEESVLPIGTSVLGLNANLTGVEEIWFLVTGTHHCDSSQATTASFTVDLNYQVGADPSFFIPMPVDSGSYGAGVVDSSSGDAVCSPVSDDWCLYATGDTGSGCGCGDGDNCNLFEAVVFVDSAQELDDVSMDWLDYQESGCVSGVYGLEGPLAVSVLTTTSAYLDAYDVYGTYDLDLSTIGAPDAALWTGVSWSATLNGETEGYRITNFSCGSTGDEATSTGWSGLPWTAGESPVTPTDDAAGIEPYDLCRGRYLTYSVEMIDATNASQAASLNSLTFSYELDVDGDGYGNEGADGLRIRDCNDGNGGVAQLTWYADCDGDGVISTTTCHEWLACTPSEALTACDALVCDGGTSTVSTAGGSWSGVAGADCDDDDNGIGAATTWYADCDDDGYTSSSTTCAASCDPSTDCATACSGGTAAASWSTTNDVDCDDDDANEFPGVSWYDDADEDGFGDENDPGNSCEREAGPTPQVADDNTDCDDSNGNAYPGKALNDADVNDGSDNDCSDGDECYEDFDDDGVGIFGSYVTEDLLDGDAACSSTPSDGVKESTFGTDCDDMNDAAQELDCSNVCGGSDTSCEVFEDGFESGDVSLWS